MANSKRTIQTNFLEGVVSVQNYIPNSNFENGTVNGWSLGVTGTLTNGIPTGTPTFGSGASGNLSIATTTSNIPSGTYAMSYISSAATTAGNMVHTDTITLNQDARPRNLSFSVMYTVASNPSNANWSGTSSNSFGIAAYDVSNSAWLPVTTNFPFIQSSNCGIATGTIQTSAGSNGVVFCIYNANATSGAITVNFDNISLSVSPTAQINPITPVTIQRLTSGTAQTYTTPAGVKWLRVMAVGGGGGGSGSSTGGDSNGTNGSDTTFGSSLITAGGGALGPINGLNGGSGGTNTINSPAITVVSVSGSAGGAGGTGSQASGGGGGNGGPSFFGGAGSGAYGSNASTGAATAGQANSGSGGGGGGSIAASTFVGSGGGSGGYVEAIILNPSTTYTYTIGSGGSGGTKIGASGTDGGAGGTGVIIVEEYYTSFGGSEDLIVAAYATKNGTQSLSTTSTTVTTWTIVNDTTSSMSTTGTFTVPISGWYNFGGRYTITSAAGNYGNLVNINGAGQDFIGNYASTDRVSSSTIRYLYAGQTLDPGIYSSNSTGTVTTASDWWVVKINSPHTSETITSDISARISGTTTSLTNGVSTKVTFTTETYDTTSSLSTTTYTAPYTGKYSVKASIQQSGTTAQFSSFTILIYKNGSQYSANQYSKLSATSAVISAFIADTVPCNANDTIEIYGFQNSGSSFSLDGGYFAIEKV